MSEQEDENNVIYLGRKVSKDNFRVFIYGKEGEKKLVNSWIEYEAYCLTGKWFPTIDDAQNYKNKANESKIEPIVVKMPKLRK